MTIDRETAEAIASELRRDPSHSVRSACAAVGASPPRVQALLARVERLEARGERPGDADALAHRIITEALEERHRLIRQEVVAELGEDKPRGGYVDWLRHLLETSDRRTHGRVERTELVGADDAPGVLETRENFETIEARVRARLMEQGK